MAIDYEKLKAELAKPDYADLIKSGNDGAILEKLNAQQADKEFVVPLSTVPTSNFGRVLFNARLAIPQLADPVKKAFYGDIFSDLIRILTVAGQADLGWPEVAGFLQQAVADGLVSQELVNEATTKQASIAERDCGGVIALSDVSFALRGIK